MVLTGKTIVDKKIVTDMIDEDAQEQMCGIDLTVKRIERYLGIGVIDFDNEKRCLPKLANVPCEKTVALPGDDSIAGYRLEPGCYLVSFNETVDVPKDCCGIARARSSLLRVGATMETSVWDPGYKGKSQSMLVVYNPNGLILGKNAKVMQIVFIRLEKDASKTYNGAYQNEGLDKKFTPLVEFS